MHFKGITTQKSYFLAVQELLIIFHCLHFPVLVVMKLKIMLKDLNIIIIIFLMNHTLFTNVSVKEIGECINRECKRTFEKFTGG